MRHLLQHINQEAEIRMFETKNELAPPGESRYKHIVDAYAMGPAQAIARW